MILLIFHKWYRFEKEECDLDLIDLVRHSRTRWMLSWWLPIMVNCEEVYSKLKVLWFSFVVSSEREF
jgi:hypothetical protein